MTNPLTGIEQITYLLFLKRLELLDRQRLKGGKGSLYGPRLNCGLPHHPDDAWASNEPVPPRSCTGHGTCRWSYIVQGLAVPNATTGEPITPHDHLSLYVFPWLRVLEKTLSKTNGDINGLETTAKRMEDAYFQLPREKTATLQRAIKSIDALFSHVDCSDDLMGDIFEYLLSEIQTSGKNGQFRTPRHLIRLMIALLNPDYRESVADPATGSAGFLINTIEHVLKRYTPTGTIRLEWNGTPYRQNGASLPIDVVYPSSKLLTGYDSDRTMARIGWMNLILHGLEEPNMVLQDALGKSLEETEQFDVILANPPFTGTVDKDDVNDRLRDLATNKSELLFVQLILHLLKRGGRAAVIVPEGVLFGSTNAHRELRRRLLLDNLLDGIISLPAGVFQPYTGVKTSILVFHKINQQCLPGIEPQTKKVWFYEVSADGYTLDAKRSPKPDPNDVWDVIEKWNNRDLDGKNYYQPEYRTERWRLVDEKTIRVFSPAVPEIAHEKEGVVRGIHELFPDLAETPDPQAATQKIIEQQQSSIHNIYHGCLVTLEENLIVNICSQKETRAKLEEVVRDLNKLFEEAKREMLERGKALPEYGRKALDPVLRDVQKGLEENICIRVERVMRKRSERLFADADAGMIVISTVRPIYKQAVWAIVREFAKLDGYDVLLRSQEVTKTCTLEQSKCWVVPVRAFVRCDEWVSSDGTLKGSHDQEGQLRPQFVTDQRIYNADSTVKAKYLDPDCIEYNNLNLSAGRYKPFTVLAVKYDPPAKIIRELQDLEGQVQAGLETLLAMIGQESSRIE
jgi:type I restriction enzyme M protein